MPLPTPFHERTSEACTSMAWSDWSGYYSALHYSAPNDSEYYAIRHSAGAIDITPLFKYDFKGPDAEALLSSIMARDVSKMMTDQVFYACWCDDYGKVIDDGTIFKLNDNHFRVFAAEPMYGWFSKFTRGYNAEITDVTDDIAGLAIQGPTSRKIIEACTGTDLNDLKYFRSRNIKIGNADVYITRTGYTGGLGYELWIENKDAINVWDSVFESGSNYLLHPVGLDVLDMVRIEAGYILNGVEFFNANHCLSEARKSTPYELGIGWTVDLDREAFCGQKSLIQEKKEGSKWALVGLEMDWDEQEKLFAQYELPAQIPWASWRSSKPVYDRSSGAHIGQATSGVWSPLKKKNLALATVKADQAGLGNNVNIEYTVEYHREKVLAKVVSLPFYNPAHKKA